MAKYKVINMIGENDETGEKYKFSFPGSQIWDMQTAYATAWKAGNHDVAIMTFVEDKNEKGGGHWENHDKATAYARQRFKLDAASYDVALHDGIKDHLDHFTTLAKTVKKDQLSNDDIKLALTKINDLYDLFNSKLDEE
jgi:hypothetical protein